MFKSHLINFNISLVFILAALAVLFPACSFAGEYKVIHVPEDFNSIREAMFHLDINGEIILADGIYNGPNNTNFESQYIKIRSENGPNDCIIDLNGSEESPSYFTGKKDSPAGWYSMVTLEGITIKNGYNKQGGAISIYGGKSVFKNCIFENNFAEQGGAVYIYGGDNKNIGEAQVDIINCIFRSNSADSGGGIFCSGMSHLTVMESEFLNNSATSVLKDYSNPGGGGAVAFMSECQATFMNSKFKNNSAFNYGGAICCYDNRMEHYNRKGSLRIHKCTIENNVVDCDLPGYYRHGGAGIYIQSTSDGLSFDLTDSVIVSNICNSYDAQECLGAGIYLNFDFASQISRCSIKDCRIIENKVNSDGWWSVAGIYIYGQDEWSPLILSNCEISRNIGGDGLNCRDGRYTIDKCRIQGNDGAAINLEFDATATITNCLITGNIEGVIGESDNDFATVVADSTIAGNRSYGINMYTNSSDKLCRIANCIVWDNGRDDLPHLRGDFEISNCCIQGSGNVVWSIEEIHEYERTPGFVNPGYWDANGTPGSYEDDFWVEGDYHLRQDSNCINAGGTLRWLIDDSDLDGKHRFVGSAIDIGAYEFQGSAPVAVAGPNQVVYAWIDGLADVNLDGSASYDNDGGYLTYLWQWVIDGNDGQTQGVRPAVKLPVGEHRIMLTVNDGIENSLPDEMFVSVIGPVKSSLWVTPSVIRRQSQSYVFVMLTLPSNITENQIDKSSGLILYPGGVQSKLFKVLRGWSRGSIMIMAYFDQSSLIDAAGANGNIVPLDVVGRLIDGRYFFGSSKVKVEVSLQAPILKRPF